MDITEEPGYQPRFDFTTDTDPGANQTGTLADLIDELNYEMFHMASGTRAKKADSNRDALNIKSLRGTLEFVKQVTGRSFSGTKKQLPLSTLKTIKLLYSSNDVSDRHLFKFLAPAGKGRPTMEFSTTTSIARDTYGASLARSISEKLASEIDPKKIKALDELLQIGRASCRERG